MKERLSAGFAALMLAGLAGAQETNLYWGDTHLHTNLSPDSYLLGNRSASPDTAYRFAKGYPVVHPYNRAKIQIGTPLDFVGMNMYAPTYVRADDNEKGFRVVPHPESYPRMRMPWRAPTPVPRPASRLASSSIVRGAKNMRLP